MPWLRGTRLALPCPYSQQQAGHLNTIGHSFKAACVRGGLDSKIVPYLSRHTFGTTAMRETGNTFAVMKAMGHADVQSMKPYQHQAVDQIADAMNKRNAEAAAAAVKPMLAK